MGLRILRWFRTAEMVLACLLFLVLVCDVAVGSLSRYLGAPIIASLEIAQGVFVWLCVLAADITLQRNGHFSVDLLTGLLPKALQRLLSLLMLTLIGVLLIYLAWKGGELAIITHDRPLPLTGIPSSYVNGALPVGFVLMAVTIAERIYAILTGRPVAAEAAAPREVM
jgi:TRAP-type transport system small permease protein